MDRRERLNQVRQDLKDIFIERDEIVDGLLLAVIARQHVLLLGPPGTAKSMLAKEVCRRLHGRYFEWLLTKFTTPEEILGPVSLPALEAGRYERVTSGKLPEADIAFLDEIFKSNSAILNSLLTMLNERVFHQGSQVMQVPLQTLVAASNELPEEDELGALYDRFLLRFTVGYIDQDHRFARLLRMEHPGYPSPQTDKPASASEVRTLSAHDLASLRKDAEAVAIPDAVLLDIIEVRKKLTAEGVVASDRRYRNSLQVLKASALLSGRERVDATDLTWFEHMLWSDPEEKPKVQEALSSVTSGLEQEARRLLIQAQEIDAYARRPWPDKFSRNRAVLEAHTKLEDIHRRLDAMRRQSLERGRDGSRLAEMNSAVVSIQARLLKEQDAWQS